jgi:rhodanese-related sulfurtransferase
MLLEKNKNTVAFLIGLGLIIVISAITLARQYFPVGQKTSDIKSQPAATTIQKAVSYMITSEDLANKIKNDKSLVIIDMRDADSFQKEHILDSKNIPLDSMADALTTLDKNKSYVIVDDGSGSGLSIVTDTFPQNGINNVSYLDGGFLDWQGQNEPTVSAGDPTVFTDQSKVRYIKSDQLKSLISSANNLAIIDVRSGDNYKAGHIPGAANIFIDDLEAQRSKLPIGKQIVLYDKDGLWAFRGAVELFDMGFFNVYCLADGLDGWQQKNFTMAK